MDSTTIVTKSSTKPSRPISTDLIIVTLDDDLEHESDVDDSPPLSTRVLSRPLRRKKHLSVQRASVPAQSPVAVRIPCVQRPQSMVSPSTVVCNDPSPLHGTSRPPMHNRTHSQPTYVRLGHPSRPYYSAIRSNMSRPNSPGSASINISRPASLASPSHIATLFPSSFARTIDDSDDGDSPISPVISPRPSSSRFSFRMGFGGFSTPPSALNSGFSVSGESEMRIALATLARESRRQDARFQVQGTEKTQGSFTSRARKLGQGLKDLIHRKHA